MRYRQQSSSWPAGLALAALAAVSVAACNGPETEIVVPLAVVNWYPSGNAACVPRETGIWVTFSEAVLEGSLTSETIGLFEGTRPVATLREFDHETATAHLVPADTLAFGTSYTIKMTTDVEAEAGGMLPTPISSTFDTLPQSGCAGNLACMVDADCAPQICSATGVCVGECAVPEDCPDVQVCNAGTCQ